MFATTSRCQRSTSSPASYDANDHTHHHPRRQARRNLSASSPTLSVTSTGQRTTIASTRLAGRYEVAEVQPAPIAAPSRAHRPSRSTDIPRQLSAAQVRNFLLGAVIVEFAVILLIVTNAAASTVTREKEDGTLDLLLTTPITSRYYIWGKLRGLVSFVLPLVAVPVVSVLMFIVYDIVRA